MAMTLDKSEEHTSELQSHLNLVCRLLLEKKDFQRQIVEQPREAELVPLHPVMQRDEVVVDIGISVIPGARRRRRPEPMCRRDRAARLGVPREVIAEEDGTHAERIELVRVRPEISRQ